MHPHPNRLPRWLRAVLLVSGALLLLSGVLWLALHWRHGFSSDDLALPHPWEHPLMQLHGFVLIPFLFALGALSPVHVPRGWREKRNLKSGLALIASTVLLAGSGYALYYWVDDLARDWVGWLHAVLGILLALVFAAHWRGRYSAPKPH